MCLAIPGKVIAINGENGDIDFGGVIKHTNLSMVDAKVGDWVVLPVTATCIIIAAQKAASP